MNVEDEKIDPVTDLGLALGYSNQRIQRKLSNDLGAGANAASRIDMTFVATDPLSELVWSPQKGPRLKCTDFSFSDKNHSLGRGSGPSNVILSPQQINTSARSNNSDKSARDNDGIGLCHEQLTYNDNSFQGTAGFLEEISTKRGESDQNLGEKNDLADSKRAYVCYRGNSRVAEIAEAMENNFPSSPDERKPHAAQIESLFNYPANEARDVGSGTQLSRMEMVLASEVNTENECDACGTPEKNVTSPGRKQVESTSLMEKKGKSKMKGGISSRLWPLEKLEATAENNLQTLMGDNACVATSKISGSESASEVEKNFQHHKEIRPEKMSTDKHSPTNSRIRSCRRKGKEKDLSDGDVKGMMSKEEDDSHESVQSCNSAGLFSSGKKRWGFEQQLTVGSKRAKKQIAEGPCSSSFVKQDSSFMNWISNMMKGFLKSKDKTPCLALTVANPNQSHESPDKNLDTSNMNQDPGCRNIGFQSVFHSIYSPKTKVQGTTTQNENYQRGFELTNKICDIDATPIACHGENFNFHEGFLLSKERFKEPISGGRAGPPTQPIISSMNLSPSKKSSDGNSAGNKNSCNLAVGVEKDRASSSSSLGKIKAMNTENIDSDPPSEGKTAHSIGYQRNLLESLWITCFTPKSSNSLLNQDTGCAVERSSDCMKLVPCSQNNANFSSNPKIVEARQQCAEEPLTSSGKELPNCATEIEASIGFNKIAVYNDQKSKCKVSSILSSPGLKDSEVMASHFARRLDALKNIMPSGVSDNIVSTITCFFCGRKGHDLQYCPETTDIEIEDLLRNMKSPNRLEELPCVCIRCFELDHWAVACPNTSSRSQNQSAHRASLANLNELQFYERFEEKKTLLDDNQEAIAARTVCNGIDAEKGPSTNYGVTIDKMRSKTNVNKKYVASCIKQNELKENQIIPWGNFDNQQVSNMPKAIFKAVRMLRLSRTDILKWTNSKISLSHLEGFFLRLRLGKWEEGLGGTGYYVACITGGAHRQGSQQNPKNSIYVNVGGIKCLAESQYISNHDFLEDELMAWLHATTRSGGKIPSEEELTTKVKERRILGF
ncbi:uncharacterized protein LOC111291806 isoform X2 [Durio zibethinus]|uniref:Uncharacterized protein LOC111291806 isoform X2 n=1 Tax=Durio zibethinus TaxID=66656 RepID=A0A6P5YGN9_DURZI|nr:uncharacterized protein LOC111291806 isoform X2 [Durio zibethinus]